jgi:hypothetical protein
VPPAASTRRAAVRQSARRALVAGLAVFVLIQAVSAVLIEVRFPILRAPRLTSRVQRFLTEANAAPSPGTVVFLGSSRVQYGLRVSTLCEQLRSSDSRPVVAFNWGVGGGGPFTSLLQWRRLRAAGGRPDLVVVEALPTLLGDLDSLPEADESRLPTSELTRDEIALLHRYAPARAHLQRDNLLLRAVPLYGHRHALVSQVGRRLLPMPQWRLTDAGQDNEEDVPPQKYASALALAHREYFDRLQRFQPGGPALAALRELLDDLRTARVPMAVLVMPEGPVFRSWYPPGAWPTVAGWLGGLCREYGAAFINARDWFDSEVPFFDSHHLTIAGSRLFSAQLAREEIAPRLRRLSEEGVRGQQSGVRKQSH